MPHQLTRCTGLILERFSDSCFPNCDLVSLGLWYFLVFSFFAQMFETIQKLRVFYHRSKSLFCICSWPQSIEKNGNPVYMRDTVEGFQIFVSFTCFQLFKCLKKKKLKKITEEDNILFGPKWLHLGGFFFIPLISSMIPPIEIGAKPLAPK